MLVAQLVAAVERLAPSALAEEWDNVGLVVGRHNQPARKLLVALELRDEVLGEARELGCDAVLVHHPPIFPTLAAVTDGSAASELVLRAAEGRVAVIAAHTNLDSATRRPERRDGRDPRHRRRPAAAARPRRPGVRPRPRRVGGLHHPPGPHRARALGVRRGPVNYAGDPWTRVERVACCTGSGGSLIGDAREAGADAYVTSDLKYHDADRAEGLPLVTLPHARAERVAHEALDQVARAGAGARGRGGAASPRSTPTPGRGLVAARRPAD